MSSINERPVAAVPRPVMAVLAATLVLQISLQAMRPTPSARAEALSRPPSAAMLRALAFGEPMIAYGILAIPVELASGDPILVYNAVILLVPVLCALAMLLLVRSLSGSTAAGLVAALLYGFGHQRAADVVHPYLHDHAATLCMFFFAQRWFAGGRWRDAVGLGLAGAFLLLGSIYPVIATALLGLPLLVWLLKVYGLARLRPAILVPHREVHVAHLEARRIGEDHHLHQRRHQQHHAGAGVLPQAGQLLHDQGEDAAQHQSSRLRVTATVASTASVAAIPSAARFGSISGHTVPARNSDCRIVTR